MLLELTPEQVTELAALLPETLRELSHEIADTENARYRSGLLARRRVLQELAGMVTESERVNDAGGVKGTT